MRGGGEAVVECRKLMKWRSERGRRETGDIGIERKREKEVMKRERGGDIGRKVESGGRESDRKEK